MCESETCETYRCTCDQFLGGALRILNSSIGQRLRREVRMLFGAPTFVFTSAQVGAPLEFVFQYDFADSNGGVAKHHKNS